MRLRWLMWVLWPAFLMGGAATAVVWCQRTAAVANSGTSASRK